MDLQIPQMDELLCVQLFCPICGAEERKRKKKAKLHEQMFSTLSE